jgi:hypothetical protein
VNTTRKGENQRNEKSGGVDEKILEGNLTGNGWGLNHSHRTLAEGRLE